jgi:diguanylate cyclase (GGDEF)-like protein
MNSTAKTTRNRPLRILVVNRGCRQSQEIARALHRDLSSEVCIAPANALPDELEEFDAAVVRDGLRRDVLAKVAALPTVVIGPGACARECRDLVRLGIQEGLSSKCAACVRENVLATTVLWAIERANLIRGIERARRQEQHEALHDPLTGLANLRLYRDRFQRLLAQGRRTGKRFALLYLDLDRFKQVNDDLGHKTGDLLLRHLADGLRACVRETDTVARVGGDEFAILFDDVGGNKDAKLLARKILRRINRPWVASGTVLSPCASIGIAVFAEDGASCKALERRADAAMYAAKRNGGNTVRHLGSSRPSSSRRGAAASKRVGRSAGGTP